MIDTGAQRATLEHAIAVFTGRLPSELTIADVDSYPLTLPTVAASMPSELLQRRPDIAAAEQRMAAANAQIGIAVAAYHRNHFAIGFVGSTRHHISRFIFVAESLLVRQFGACAVAVDGGARDASKAQAQASYDQTVAAYRQTILTAIQKVEDNLSMQQQALQAAQEALTIALNQYKADTVSFLNVATAQAAEYSVRRTELGLRSQQFSASRALIKALDG